MARLLGCAPKQVLPFSTGVIMEPLPVERIVAGAAACARRAARRWLVRRGARDHDDRHACRRPRRGGSRIDGVPVTVTGIAKGAGMIHPDMATMLAFVATDAPVARGAARRLAREVADVSFNCVTVDGDTSTNDSFVHRGDRQGRDAARSRDAADPRVAALRAGARRTLPIELAQAIVRDGEGATKFIAIRVEGGRDVAECRRVALRASRIRRW